MSENTIDLEKLKVPLDAKAITQHPTKTYLSSIKAVYVTERFNDVFGIGKWQTRVEKEHVNHESGMVIVKVIFTVPSLDIYYESFGGNDNGGSNNKNFDLGDAYKGATTDAITKIGSFLGVAIDVFKGEKTHLKTPAQPKDGEKEKDWLNKLDSDKNFTKQWVNIIDGIEKGTVKNVSDVREHYKVSKVIEADLEVIFKTKNK